MYQITDYTKQRAKEIGVEVRPSLNPDKKVDVFKNNHKIASIGSINYLDYPSYIREKGKSYANFRRRLYHLRHSKDHRLEGLLSKFLLW